MTLKSVIFDVDGTLADTEKEGHLWAFNRAFQLWNLPFRWGVPLYRELLNISGGKERLAYYLAQHPEYHPLSNDEIREIYRLKTNLFMERVRAGVVALRPGVRSLIGQCYQEGIPVGIATTTNYDNVETLLLRHFGVQWKHMFPVVVAGDEVPIKKPDPAVYVRCLEQLGVSASEAIAVEDSAVGLKAATGARISTIVTMNTWTYHHTFLGALAILTSLGTTQTPAYGTGPDGWGRYRVTVDQLRAWLV
ncbi:MAG: HAD-IA family hydrolase [Firmicutes bacterium]|jgi:HAD superfamily hydrolase (TIGR01509 family)|uniref:Phosphatase n=1 Tax=Sulfobacillus benefaciens TaxID=453960 RepID=A0A2T2X3S3_9FIRM|nr:HAD-IA family hydrolase [Bacillota bacterium]MCL5015948.1 HAD-IA family hydrolase [Bacillota bacterium]PSR29106.1 MAG: phosphatase [Sulfobacillus benefaciens]